MKISTRIFLPVLGILAIALLASECSTPPAQQEAVSLTITGSFAAAHFLAVKVKSNADSNNVGAVLSASKTPPSPDTLSSSLSFHSVNFTKDQEQAFLLGTTEPFTNSEAAAGTNKTLTDKASADSYGVLYSNSEYWLHLYLSEGSDTITYKSFHSEKLQTSDYTLMKTASSANASPEMKALKDFLKETPIAYQTGKAIVTNLTSNDGPAEVRLDNVYKGQCAVPNIPASCTTGALIFPEHDGTIPFYLVLIIEGKPSKLSSILGSGKLHYTLRGYN